AGGVAALEEVEYLRKRGVKLPLMLLEDLFFDEIAPALEREVKLSVSSLEYAHELQKVAEKMGRTATVHVNVDTGMGRLGVQIEGALEMVREIASLPNLRLEGLFTHFPIADEKDKDFSFSQIESFSSFAGQLASEGIRPDYLHVANSGAVLDFPEQAGFDIIRPGVATFGMYPSEDVDHGVPLKEAMTLKSAFIKVDRFAPGKSIGYGRTFTTSRPSLIGVLPIGYGDGFIRDYSNNAEVLVHGLRAPVVGRVSMDMITVDLTDIPEIVGVGDEAVLMGRQRWKDRESCISSEELARRAKTITYEVTCLFGKRVPRLFVRHGSVIGQDAMSETYLNWK
ncbi:MAG TPA: alanine racemase, partial [Sediminispirochaeta sp.]|nr:alanine racemase [Sediminispirochaeta sp.]